MVKLTDSNIQYFSQGEGKPIVLLPFGGLTVGYMAGLSQNLADCRVPGNTNKLQGFGKEYRSGKASHSTLWRMMLLA